MTPTEYLNYESASQRYRRSVHQLKKLVVAKRLTRHRSSRDLRVTLLDVRELEAIYGDDALNTPAA